jgi:hypothetical protein
MPSFFDPATYADLKSRLNNIKADQHPKWGKMNAAQMMRHCQLPLQTALAQEETPLKSNFIVKLLFKKMLYSDKPFKKNAPTPPVFQVQDDRNFKLEKKKLIYWMKALYADRENENRRPHPVFGHYTKEQWGKMQWKHLNHHFEQFGV